MCIPVISLEIGSGDMFKSSETFLTNISIGKYTFPLFAATLRQYLIPAFILNAESGAIPILAAILSAILKPMPMMSSARE